VRLVEILAALAVLVCGSAQAQPRFLTTDRLINSSRLREAFADAARPSRPWTVQVRRGDADVALGVIVDKDGLVLTKLSEVQAPRPASTSETDPPADSSKKSDSLTCRLPDDRELAAAIVAEDPETDLALLRIGAKNLPTVTWSTRGDLELGRWVVSPTVGGEPTSVGVVSARRRALRAQRIPGILGVELDVSGGPARISQVFEMSAAADAGLEVGDVVERLGEAEIANGRALIRLVRRYQPGDVVQLQVKRGEQTRAVEVTLSHPFGRFLSQYAQQMRMGGELSRRRDGFPAVFSHDAMLPPENCGGPLVDLSGAAVGINISRSGRIETLALPADVVQESITRMRASLEKPPQSASSADR
jgi:serine protease Do